MTLEELATVVAPLNWTFAKTMPQWPHWYIVRSPENEQIYTALFFAWQEYGVWGEFLGKPQKYLHLNDGYKYWGMADDLEGSRIINRAEM